jgi:hypothetical protein
VIIGDSGGLRAEGLDFEGRRWKRLFEGEYTKAKEIMVRLDAEQVPNRMALPPGLPTSHVVVEVMHRWVPQAREVVAALES